MWIFGVFYRRNEPSTIYRSKSIEKGPIKDDDSFGDCNVILDGQSKYEEREKETKLQN